ncbi:MAG: hypothetical protein RL318_935 [Fibrobacterota bacterium]|jgi:uncharacterized protein (TIGR02145 family)
MKTARLLWILPLALTLISCDRRLSEPVANDASTISLAPRIVSATGAALPEVDTVRIVVLNANSPTAAPYYERAIDWHRHGDTIVGIPQNANLLVRIFGVKKQPDGALSIWWSGEATSTFAGTQSVDVHALTVPVLVGDMTAPVIIGREGDTVHATDEVIRMKWRLQDDSSFFAIINGDTVKSTPGNEIAWMADWPQGKTFSVRAEFRDKSGNLRVDTLTAIRRERVSMPTLSQPSGSYIDTIRVKAVTQTPGAVVQYSMNNGQMWSSLADTGLVLTVDAELRFRAIRDGMTASAMNHATYKRILQVAAPALSHESGSYNDTIRVKATSATPGAKFKYSTNGVDWKVLDDSGLIMRGSANLRVQAERDGLSPSTVTVGSYKIQAAAPVLSQPAGSYEDTIRVKATSATPGAYFKYSTDGVEWKALDDSGLILGMHTTLRVQSMRSDVTASELVTVTYAIQPRAPTFSVATGTSSSTPLGVKLKSKLPGGVIETSQDSGTTWVVLDSVLVRRSMQLRARVSRAGLATSAVSMATYTVALAAPMVSLPAGTYHSYRKVGISQASGDTIRYTLDGTVPSATSSRYVDSILVDTTAVLKARAFGPEGVTSAVVTAGYVLNVDPESVTISVPVSTMLWSARNVALVRANPDLEVRCTSNGLLADFSSPLCHDSILAIGGLTVNGLVVSVSQPRLEPARVSFRYPSTWWNPEIAYDTLRDVRDGRIYRIKAIGGQVWMAENLKYAGAAGTTGICSKGSSDSCEKYGRSYTWSDAMTGMPSSAAAPSGVQGLCPAGWHVPSDQEWATLRNATDSVGSEFKSMSGWGSDAYSDRFGFRAMPAGIPAFVNPGTGAYWWSSTSLTTSSSTAWSVSSSNTLARYGEPNAYQLSLRCVKDPQ